MSAPAAKASPNWRSDLGDNVTSQARSAATYNQSRASSSNGAAATSRSIVEDDATQLGL